MCRCEDGDISLSVCFYLCLKNIEFIRDFSALNDRITVVSMGRAVGEGQEWVRVKHAGDYCHSPSHRQNSWPSAGMLVEM